MSMFKLTVKAVWRSASRYRFDGVPRRIYHGLSSGVEQSSQLLFHTIGCPVYYSTEQYCTHPLQRRIKVHTPCQYSVHKLSSLKKPLLFTDDLLQKHIKQLVAEWNQIQKQLTGDQSDTGHFLAQDSSKRLHFLERIVNKIEQHQQYSADISELEDIISG